MNKRNNIRKKKLIILAFLLFVILVALIIVLGTTKNMDRGNVNFLKDAEFQQNTKKLIEPDDVLLKYGNDVYILDEKSNSIIKYASNTGISSFIINLGSDSYKKLFVRSNHLIFSSTNATYYSDLNGNNILKLTNGEVVYINDDIYLFVNHATSRDELYIISYNNKTFKSTTNLSNMIATGKRIKYLKADGNSIYFTSVNSQNDLIVFEVNIKDSNVRIITKRSAYDESENMTYQLSDILKDDENYFYVVEELISTTNEQGLLNYRYLYRRSINDSNEEIMDENVGPYLVWNAKKSSIMYEIIEESGNRVWQELGKFETSNDTWEQLKNGDVTEYFSIDGTTIHKENTMLVDLNMDLSDYQIVKVICIEGEYYFSIANEINQYWYHCDLEGNHLVKIK